MITLAILALVASVLVWAAPSSQAQANQAPFADAGTDLTLNPGATAGVDLDGSGSLDVDGEGAAPADDPGTAAACLGCTFQWEIETGPYDWIEITSDTNRNTATFNMPSEAFVDKVADSDPQKYEIVVRLTVTDDDGATDSDTVSININRRPVADIQLYAGLRDEDIVDADLGAQGHFPIDAVIDGPGENGNRDNEWDVMEGAYLQLDGSGSTDENPQTGRPATYWWTRPQLRGATAGYALDTAQTTPGTAAQQRLEVAVDNGASGADSNVTTITFVGVDENDDDTDDTLVVETLPNVAPNAPVTVFYQLNVCDGVDDAANPTSCTGRTGATLIRIVVHDTSATPEVEISAALTAASDGRGDPDPQSTVSQFTGVENQFIVGAGSTVQLTASVEDDDQDSDHTFVWNGATPGSDRSMAVVRVPADADDGDTIDGSVTVIDRTRITVTTTFQLLVGENTKPTAGGVPANMGTINLPAASGGGALISVHSVTDGFQNPKDGSTVTLRGVGNDADGDSIITAWALREGPNHSALEGAISAWVAAINAIDRTGTQDAQDTAKAAADALDIGGGVTVWQVVAGALQDMQEPDMPLFELSGALTDTVSFDVPNLESGENAGTILLFTVIDSNGVASAQLVYIHVSADNNAPNADAGNNEQVDPEAFVRLNGSASSDPDVGDSVEHRWQYVRATMDPAPDERSPLSADEIDELNGWILTKTATGFDYIVNAAGVVTGTSNKLQSYDSAYPYFDAPDLSGFNNLKLTFRLAVFDDEAARDVDGDGATTTSDVTSLSEVTLDMDLDGDGEKTNASVDTVDEAQFGLDLNNNLAIDNALNLGTATVNEAAIRAFDTEMVTITVVNRYFSGQIPGPDYCYGVSLGGPQTYPFDDDKDGVADICSLDTTRRATVARQNALETLANLNPTEFRDAVNAECGEPGFKQRNHGDDPDDLETDVCETGRVTPPPAAADPATADEFFSGTITGPDFCTNHSLGGARTYAHDSDGDGVADQCSLATTKREAIARQQALEGFIVSFSGDEQTEQSELTEWLAIFNTAAGERTTAQTARLDALNTKYAEDYDETGGTDDELDSANDGAETTAVQARIDTLAAKSANATRYSNAVDAACRALGSQDFGDAASALARDACAPKPGQTGDALPDS